MDYIVEYEDRLLKKNELLIVTIFSEGRRLSDPFIHLPPKRDLPDYYEQIKARNQLACATFMLKLSETRRCVQNTQ